jgi:hypothetical protein
MNAALVPQTFLDTNVDLSMQTVATGIHRSADHGGEGGVDEKLATHDNEDTLPAWIA